MQIPKQIQSFSFSTLIKPAVATGFYITVSIVAVVAGPLFGAIALTALNLGLVIYLKNRWVTRFFSTSLTCLILTVSLSILIPPTTLIAFPLALLGGSCSIVYATYIYLNKNL